LGQGGSKRAAARLDAGSFDPFGSFDQYHWTDVAHLTSSKAAPSHGRVTETPGAPRSVAACAGKRTQRDVALWRCAPRGSRSAPVALCPSASLPLSLPQKTSRPLDVCFFRQRYSMIRGAVVVGVWVPGISAWTGTGCAKEKELHGFTCVACAPATFSLRGFCGSGDCPGCTACPAGTYQAGSGMSYWAQWAGGGISSSGAALHCDSCDPGTSSANGASVWTYCAAGKLTTANGRGLSDGGCQSCDAGTFSTGRGVRNPETCSACGVHVRLVWLGSLHLVHQMRPRKIVELRRRTKPCHV
jgi:hypothetical protein